MTEKIIYLEGVDLVEFFGVNNVIFEQFKKHFPKLKIRSRGNEIHVSGKIPEIEDFEQKLDQLLKFLSRYNTLTPENIDEIIAGTEVNNYINNDIENDIVLYGESGRPIRAITTNQKRLVEECMKNDLLLAIGPAGTGKTYMAIALAVRMLKMKEVKRIILTRPAVEAGERLGFLPGDYKVKLDPYLQPLYDALNDMIPSKKLKTFLDEGIVQIAPLAYMRGRTLDNAFAILDEAQNATGNQLKMFLTRMGKNAKFIVTGDITQIDLTRKQDSGLVIAEKILMGIEGISVINFDEKDLMRHRLVKHIIEAYRKNSE